VLRLKLNTQRFEVLHKTSVIEADLACPETLESVEKLGSEQILFAETIPCCATEYCREEQRQ